MALRTFAEIGPALRAAATGLTLLAGGTSPALGQIPLPAWPEGTAPFLRDSRLDAHLRTFYYDRDNYDDSRDQAWAVGGWLTYRSGYLADFLRIGATGYTSLPLYAPEEHDGTNLLKPGQKGYAVLGQAYAEAKFTDRIFGAVGRKEYDTPYINRNDSRMTPKTFEAITAYGTAGGTDADPDWRFIGGHFTKIKENASDRFVWMSRDAGAFVDRGVSVAGLTFDRGQFAIGATNYYSDDIINIFYTDAKYTFQSFGGYDLTLAAQFSDQRSTGDDLLTGFDFSTHQWGVRADLGVGAATLTLAYTDTASGTDMRGPWGGYPGYTSVQVQDFNRANESAVMLRAAYDFTSHGVPGLTAYALVVYGSGRKAPFFNETEYDFNIEWRPGQGLWKGAALRLRYAHIDQRGGGDPSIDNLRLIATYDF